MRGVLSGGILLKNLILNFQHIYEYDIRELGQANTTELFSALE